MADKLISIDEVVKTIEDIHNCPAWDSYVRSIFFSLKIAEADKPACTCVCHGHEAKE